MSVLKGFEVHYFHVLFSVTISPYFKILAVTLEINTLRMSFIRVQNFKIRTEFYCFWFPIDSGMPKRQKDHYKRE